MVDVQDGDVHLHKRTAIPQLLNPVSSPKRQEEHGFASYRGALQYSTPSPAARSDLTPPVLPPATTETPTFNLRAADWGQGVTSPPSTVHYASSPDTNGSVRARSASYPTFDSGPRPNDANGYVMTASFSPLLYPPSANSSPSPAPHSLHSTPGPFYPDGRAGKRSDNFELNYHSSVLQEAKLRVGPSRRALVPVLQTGTMLPVKNHC